MNDKKPNILVIDDDTDVLSAICAALKHEGYDVISSTKPIDIPKPLPDVILLDIFLSGHDWRKIAKDIKIQKQTCQIPIIMISAHHNIEKIVEESGVDEFLEKPFTIDKLLQTVNKFVN